MLDEIASIRSWEGNSEPVGPAFRRTTWIVLASTLVLAGAALFPRFGPVILAIEIAGAVGALFLFLVCLLDDLGTLFVRNRRTPLAAVKYLMKCLKHRNFPALRFVTASYPGAEARLERAPLAWSRRLNPNGNTWPFIDFEVSTLKGGNVENDVVLVQLKVKYMVGSLAGCFFFGGLGFLFGLLGFLLFSRNTSDTFRKLLIWKSGRWYFVNPLPEERMDLELARHWHDAG